MPESGGGDGQLVALDAHLAAVVQRQPGHAFPGRLLSRLRGHESVLLSRRGVAERAEGRPLQSRPAPKYGRVNLSVVIISFLEVLIIDIATLLSRRLVSVLPALLPTQRVRQGSLRQARHDGTGRTL